MKKLEDKILGIQGKIKVTILLLLLILPLLVYENCGKTLQTNQNLNSQAPKDSSTSQLDDNSDGGFYPGSKFLEYIEKNYNELSITKPPMYNKTSNTTHCEGELVLTTDVRGNQTLICSGTTIFPELTNGVQLTNMFSTAFSGSSVDKGEGFSNPILQIIGGIYNFVAKNEFIDTTGTVIDYSNVKSQVQCIGYDADINSLVTEQKNNATLLIYDVGRENNLAYVSLGNTENFQQSNVFDLTCSKGINSLKSTDSSKPMAPTDVINSPLYLPPVGTNTNPLLPSDYKYNLPTNTPDSDYKSANCYSTKSNVNLINKIDNIYLLEYGTSENTSAAIVLKCF